MHATTSSFTSLSDLSPIIAPILFWMNYGLSHLLNLLQSERFSQTCFLPHPVNHQFLFHPCTYPTHLATELPHSPTLPNYPTHPSNLTFHFFQKKFFLFCHGHHHYHNNKELYHRRHCCHKLWAIVGNVTRWRCEDSHGVSKRYNVVLSKIVMRWRCEMKVCLLSLCLCLGYCGPFAFLCILEKMFLVVLFHVQGNFFPIAFVVFLFQEDDNDPNCPLLVEMFVEDDAKPTMLVFIFFFGSTKVNNELGLLSSSFFCCYFREDNDEMACHCLLQKITMRLIVIF